MKLLMAVVMAFVAPGHPGIVFLGGVVVAGIVGGLIAKTSIFFTRALPAAIGLVLVLLARKPTAA